jgi:flotillin
VDKAKGMFQAEVIEAQGRAEAEAKRQKAEAWARYNQAAIVEQMLEKLPEMTRALAAPLANIDRVVVVGGQDGNGAGISKLTGDMTVALGQLPPLIEALTGIDLIATLESLPRIQSTAEMEQAEEAREAASDDGHDGKDAQTGS